MATLTTAQANQASPVMLSGPARMLWPLAAVLLLCLQAYLTVRHEPFVDEWQALQLAAQSPDLAVLLEHMRYEGHPPLWHVILRLLAGIVGPAYALMAAALIFGLGSQLLILLRSPFPLWLRLAFALSEPMLFEFGVISRSYTLGVFLLLCCMALWNDRRWFYLPLALLPCTEFLFGVMTGGLLVMRFAEKRLWWPGIALWLAASLFAAWTVIPAPDFIPANHPTNGLISGTFIWAVVMSSVAVPLQWADGPLWNEIPRSFLWFVLWAPLMFAIWQQTRGRWAERVTIGLYMAITWAFYALYYALALRHMFLLNVLLIAVLWRQAADSRQIVPLLRVWAVVGGACGLVTAGVNVVTPFDTGRLAARYIVEQDLAGENWVAMPVMQGQGIAAMTGMTFEGYAIECRSDFIRWNYEKAPLSPEAITAWLDQPAQSSGRFYIISDRAVPDRANAELLKYVPRGYYDQAYYLYAVNADDAEQRAMRPRCVEGMNPLEPVGW